MAEEPAPVEGGKVRQDVEPGQHPLRQRPDEDRARQHQVDERLREQRRREGRVGGSGDLAPNEVELDQVADSRGGDRVDPDPGHVRAEDGRERHPGLRIGGLDDVAPGDSPHRHFGEMERERDAERAPADGGQLIEEDPNRVKELAHVFVNLPDGAALQARRRRGALAAHVGGGRPLQRRARHGPRDVRRRAPATERHGRAPHRPRAPDLTRRPARALAPDARVRDGVPHRLRPCGHLDPERRREAPLGAGNLARGSRPRALRRDRVGLAARVRRHDHGPVPPHGRLDGLPARTLHDGRRVRPGRDALLRPPLPQGLDLPGEPDHQLVPVPPDRAVRPRARARGGGRRPHVRPLPVRRRSRGRRHDRDRAPRDDSRRRGRRRQPRRQALGPRGRARGDRAVRRARGAGDRGRASRPGVRHRRAQGDAGARPARLRDRPRPRASPS